jgi:putative transposase
MRRPLFAQPQMANLFLDILSENRKQGRFALHEFVAMPDHFHLILTPEIHTPLEKALQYIKGGFSFRAKREPGLKGLVWQEGFTNHRIRDSQDYLNHRDYIHENPVKKGLAEKAEDYPYSSAYHSFIYPRPLLDPVPPWLKPRL